MTTEHAADEVVNQPHVTKASPDDVAHLKDLADKATFTDVESSNLAAVAYDSSENVLFVRFKTTGVYAYHSVPQGTYDALLTAESKGKFFNENIKQAFAYAKVA